MFGYDLAQSSSQFPTGTKMRSPWPLIDPVTFDEGCVSAFARQTTSPLFLLIASTMAPSPEAQPSALGVPPVIRQRRSTSPMLLPTITSSPLIYGVLRELLTTKPGAERSFT